MRASDFVFESRRKKKKRGKLSKRQQSSSRGMHTFTDGNYDRLYELNRIMMAVASSDGTQKPVLDGESWVAKNNTAHPYTEVEQAKLKKAYQTVGVKYKDLNRGDLRSQELADTNTRSLLKGFRGFK